MTQFSQHKKFKGAFIHLPHLGGGWRDITLFQVRDSQAE